MNPVRRAPIRVFTGLCVILCALSLVACQHRIKLIDPALTQNPQDPGVVDGLLDNGFSYFLRSANSSEQNRNIEVRLVVRTGSIHERNDERGYAHLLEHMVFRGTKRFSATQIEELLAEAGLRWGVDVNATTHYGATIYRFSLTESEADLLPSVMALCADFIDAVNFDPSSLGREKKIVDAEWRYRYGHRNFVIDPLVSTALVGSEYKNRPPVGDLATVRAATPESLKKFWRRNYHAGNAALVVTGGIVPWELEGLIETSFAQLPVRGKRNALPVVTSLMEDFRPIKGLSEVEYLSYVNPDLLSPQVNINFISRVRKTNTVDSVQQGFKEDLLFKAVGHLMVKRLATTQHCSHTTLHSSLLETGQSINGLEIDIADTEYLTCLQALSVVSSELFKNGLVRAEYEQLRQSFRSIAIESADRYRSSSPEDLAASLIQHIVYGTPVLPASLLETLYLEMIDSVSAAEFNNVLSEIPLKYKVVFGARGPTDNKLPKKTLMMLATGPAGNAKPLERFSGREVLHGVLNPDQLLGNLVAVHNSAPKVKQVYQNNNVYEWQLSNGARVVFHRDERYDYIALAAMAKGGYLQVDQDLVKAAEMLPRFIGVNGAGGYLQKSLQRLRSEKSLYSEVQVNPTHHGILAYGVAQDLDLLLEIVSAYFDEPVIVEPASSMLLQKVKTEQRNGTLENRFWEKYVATGSRELETSHMKAAQRLLFNTPADFTFVFVGNASADHLARELNRLERHTNPGALPDGGYTLVKASGGSQANSLHDYKSGQAGRVNVGLFHSCVIPEGLRSNAELNLRLISDILERRLRYDLREDRGLSYQLDTKLLSDTTDHRHRIHQVEYSVRPEDVPQAEALVSSVLNEIGKFGITDQELRFALKREKKRRRDQSFDYLATAKEMAVDGLGRSNLHSRAIADVPLGQLNELARCFSSDNTTYIAHAKDNRSQSGLSFD